MAAKKTTRKTPEPTLRHVWLAGLGLIAVARREAVAAATDASDRLQAARKQAETFAGQAQRDVLGRLAEVREQGEASVERFSADVEARLEPVLTKLGLKKPARKAAPRARKKPAARKTRSTPVRKPAAKRTVRRSRA
ncbi:hypothetical protein LJR143_001897 [Pseudoxanthomonas sp. LjRoot143]|uniref:hypothetical protein n=1 Tax=unclassified Pseudoxanthomonas TaxID=2645906 RepID=UPI00177FFA58|nr:hypothetical protein [Pseudoxanthomonas sp. PXM01]MBD9467600.1 hypothetical protein [Pseudoxanthomonas sp. PXM01]